MLRVKRDLVLILIDKTGIVEEEADETPLWNEYLLDFNWVLKDRGEAILKEVHELITIVPASAKTAKRNRK